MKTLLISFAGFFLFSACSNNKPPNLPDFGETKPLEGTYWMLTELNGQLVAAPKDGAKPSFIYFNAETKRVAASGGCNVMGGSYELMDGNRIKFGQMISTRMACPDMTNEEGLTSMAGMVDNYAIQGDNLMFAKARMAPTARFKAVAAPVGFKAN
mgnify:CR=1 FL=1